MIVPTRFLAVLALALASSAVLAAPPNGPGGQQQGGPGGQGGQQRQEKFSEMKQIRVEGMQARIAILQTALGCVNAATSHEQMKPCEQQAHQSMEALEQQQRAKMQALRSGGWEDSRRGPPGQGGPNGQGGKQQ
jgi:hypothetical protein